ncbi:MAG: DNA polymerase III subunit delta' [Kiloniellales bacterium]
MSRKPAKSEATPPGPPAPRANPRLLGHADAERLLLRAQRSGRLPHAWLICGPRGIGKATLAFRFARFVLAGGPGTKGNAAPMEEGGLFGGLPAPQRDDLWTDPESAVFRRIAAGAHGDLMTVERGVNLRSGKPRSEITVDEVRPVRDFLHMTAAEGGWRIVVVDSADEMNPNAANALLKVLEEPPARALLLLVSHQPGRLVPTIRSRCCRLALEPLPEATVLTLLADYAPELAEDERAALARLAEGSIGRALDLAAEGGLALYGEIVALLQDLPRLDVTRLHALAERLAKGGQRDDGGTAFRTGGELLVWWLARLIRAGSQGALPPEVVAGEAALIDRLLRRRGLAQWLALWDKVARLFARAESANLDRKQVVITAFLELEALAA